jgi:hypothetical protein
MNTNVSETEHLSHSLESKDGQSMLTVQKARVNTERAGRANPAGRPETPEGRLGSHSGPCSLSDGRAEWIGLVRLGFGHLDSLV